MPTAPIDIQWDTKLNLKIVSLIACTRNEKYILPVSLCAWIIPSFLFLSISVCIDVQDVYVFMNSIMTAFVFTEMESSYTKALEDAESKVRLPVI